MVESETKLLNNKLQKAVAVYNETIPATAKGCGDCYVNSTSERLASVNNKGKLKIR